MVAQLLRERRRDDADVCHQKYAPHGTVIEFPADDVTTYDPRPRHDL
ncbi:hypothetical protein [Pseudonocardia sp. KRD291]|nr:hypothetical protein [Pseudonocardia sp. KRD291]MBW0101525.1 hypothetical protein [Pseudonocardia sp. KRD291]